jgi:hypothetical protein
MSKKLSLGTSNSGQVLEKSSSMRSTLGSAKSRAIRCAKRSSFVTCVVSCSNAFLTRCSIASTQVPSLLSPACTGGAILCVGSNAKGSLALRTWSGLYEQNELDGNPVIGRWSRVPNVYTAAGFPGAG